MCKNSFTDYYDYHRFEQSSGYVSIEPTSSVFCHSYLALITDEAQYPLLFAHHEL